MPDEKRPPEDDQPAEQGGVTPSEQGTEWPTSGVSSRPSSQMKHEPAPKRGLASVGFMLDALRRRRSGRIFLWGVVGAMALTGIGLLAYPFVTDIWADRVQERLETEYQALDANQNQYREKAREEGSAVTRMTIPRLGVRDLIVVEGITGNALRAGAGHYPNTALPGDVTGNVAIAGHRTGFGQPFRHLDRLDQGDKIYLETPLGRYTYEVIPPFDSHDNPWITHAKDWTVVSTTPEPSLTLTTCDPPGTSKNRLIVRARLIRSVPAG